VHNEKVNTIVISRVSFLLWHSENTLAFLLVDPRFFTRDPAKNYCVRRTWRYQHEIWL